MGVEDIDMKTRLRMNEVRVEALIKLLAKEGILTSDEIENAVKEILNDGRAGD